VKYIVAFVDLFQVCTVLAMTNHLASRRARIPALYPLSGSTLFGCFYVPQRLMGEGDTFDPLVTLVHQFRQAHISWKIYF
jgi:hypothetical protein